jgi:hypothetical protein
MAKIRVAHLAGSNATIRNTRPLVTSTNARVLLLASLMKFGAPPPARDPDNPTAAEKTVTPKLVEDYQTVFRTH